MSVLPRRASAALALLLPALVLTACSGGTTTTASTPTAGSSTAASTTPSDTPSTTPTDTPSSTPTDASSSPAAATGTATDFCGSFKELEGVSQKGKSPSEVAADFQATAADIRKYAPSEIKDAANTYADVIDAVGQSLSSGGAVNSAAVQVALAKALKEKPADIGKVALYVAKNCK